MMKRRGIEFRLATIGIVGLIGVAGAGLVTDHDEASSFFGGLPAKVAFVDAGSKSTIKYIDFSESSLEIRRVCSGSSGNGANIQVSWDGTRVAYDNGSKCFVAKLEENTSSVHEVGTGINPQWWVHPTTGKEYVLMQRGVVPGNGNGIYSQEVDAQGNPVGSAALLLDEPMANGGRSGDGTFMANVDEEHEACSHGHGMYVLDDPLAAADASIAYWIFATAEGWYTGGTEAYRGYCNGSVSPASPGHTYYGAMAHMGSGHLQIFIRKPDPAYYTTATPVQLGVDGADGGPSCTADDKVIPDFTEPMLTLMSPQFLGLSMRDNHWGYSDWSNHPDYLAATGGSSSTSSGNKAGYVINIGKTPGQAGFGLRFAEDEVAQPDVWVQSSTSAVRPAHPARGTAAVNRHDGATMVDLRGREVRRSTIGRGVYFNHTGAKLLIRENVKSRR